MIKKGLLSALLLPMLCFSVKTYADTVPCAAAATCGPCGYEASPNLPPYGGGLNPLTNYVATADSARCRGYFSGFYLGAAWGGGKVDYDLEIGGKKVPELLGDPSSGLDSKSRGYLTAIFNAGFNLVFDYFLLGLEVGYNYRSRTNPISYYDLADFMSTTIPEFGFVARSVPCKIYMDINSQHAVTLDLLPGFVINRFAGFLRLGVEQAKYTWDRRVCFPSILFLHSPEENTAIVEGQDFIETVSKTGAGYRLGFGFAFAASTHVSLTLNFIHTFGQKLTRTPNVAAIAANAPVIFVAGSDDPIFTTVFLPELAANNVIEPQRNEVTVGVRFRL